MLKIIKTFILLTVFIFAFSFNVKAQSETRINDLVEKAKELDGSQVIVQGEVIGECLERGEYSWININDGTNAMGVWVKSSDAKQLEFYGDYHHVGDTVRITATFQRACKEHGGEADLHSITVEKIQSGQKVKENISYLKLITTTILVIIALAIVFVYFKFLKMRND